MKQMRYFDTSWWKKPGKCQIPAKWFPSIHPPRRYPKRSWFWATSEAGYMAVLFPIRLRVASYTSSPVCISRGVQYPAPEWVLILLILFTVWLSNCACIQNSKAMTHSNQPINSSRLMIKKEHHSLAREGGRPKPTKQVRY